MKTRRRIRGRGAFCKGLLKGEGERAASHKNVCPWPEPRHGRVDCAGDPSPNSVGTPSLPLPLERVKSGAAGSRLRATGLAGVETTTGRPLTEFGRRRPNLPLPQERVKSGGAGGLDLRAKGLSRSDLVAAEDPSNPLPQERDEDAAAHSRTWGVLQRSPQGRGRKSGVSQERLQPRRGGHGLHCGGGPLDRFRPRGRICLSPGEGEEPRRQKQVLDLSRGWLRNPMERVDAEAPSPNVEK